jgi:hypothetical protein
VVTVQSSVILPLVRPASVTNVSGIMITGELLYKKYVKYNQFVKLRHKIFISTPVFVVTVDVPTIFPTQ